MSGHLSGTVTGCLHSVLEDKPHTLRIAKDGQIAHRVAVDDDEIGLFARLHRAYEAVHPACTS